MSEFDFYSAGQRLIDRTPLRNESGERRFVSHFGISAGIVSTLWDLVRQRLPTKYLPIHLLWCLFFLKVYATESVLCSIAGTNEKTFRTHVWVVMRCIAAQKEIIVRN